MNSRYRRRSGEGFDSVKRCRRFRSGCLHHPFPQESAVGLRFVSQGNGSRGSHPDPVRRNSAPGFARPPTDDAGQRRPASSPYHDTHQFNEVGPPVADVGTGRLDVRQAVSDLPTEESVTNRSGLSSSELHWNLHNSQRGIVEETP